MKRKDESETLEGLEDLEDQIDLEEARAVLDDVRKSGSVSWEKIKAEQEL
jgi:hypothetical protein